MIGQKSVDLPDVKNNNNNMIYTRVIQYVMQYLIVNFCLNLLLKFDLSFLIHKFNTPSARQFNT